MILDEKRTMQQKFFRQFAENEFNKELLERLDQTGAFDYAIYRKMADYGIHALRIPKEYGGCGAGYLSYALLIEEFARVSAVMSIYANNSNSLGIGPLLIGGTKEQKEKYLPKLADGSIIMAFALTEPEAGSDAGSIMTTAVRDGDAFVLNGRKCFISGASIADYCLVFAKTDMKAKGTRGISTFIVDMKLPGVSVGTPERKMGIEGFPTADVVFENVRVPEIELVGQLNNGFYNAMKTLDGGRLGMAAQAVGIAQNCLEEATQYAKDRKQFGKPIGKFQGISFMLADMATDVEAARQLVYHAATLLDEGRPATKECSIAKFFAAEAANRCAYKAVQVFGGYGYMKDYKVERLYRDARICSIYEGTSQIQQMVIASHILQ